MNNLLLEIDNFNMEEFVELKDYCEQNIRRLAKQELDDLKKELAELREDTNREIFSLEQALH